MVNGMSDLAQLQQTLAAALPDAVVDFQTPRPHHLYCRLARGAAPQVAKLLRNEYQSELTLLVANDRRADLGVYEVHYLFDNPR